MRISTLLLCLPWLAVPMMHGPYKSVEGYKVFFASQVFMHHGLRSLIYGFGETANSMETRTYFMITIETVWIVYPPPPLFY